MQFYLKRNALHKIQSSIGSICFYVFISAFSAASQQPLSKNVNKILPSLSLKLKTEKPSGKSMFTVAVTDIKQFILLLQQHKAGKIVSVYEPAQLVVVECTWRALEDLLDSPLIMAVDEKKKAREELLFGAVDYSANKISVIQDRFPLLNGSSVGISIKEQNFDTTDIDFKGRTIASIFSSPNISSHASIIGTIIGGAGNAWYNTKGAAWASYLSSANFQNLLPEPDSYYRSPAILVQNHSYGTGIENYYGLEATGYDASVINNPSLLHIFSAGNSGAATPATGNFAGITGYSNLTGNFKQAKNIISVGHTDSFGIVLPASSKGPAFDGRVKPELVAFGEDGSSGAAALISGVAAVLHQSYKDRNNGLPAPASLIKAVLINSAEDAATNGIDYLSGYGSLNADKAVQTIIAGRYFQGTVSNNGQKQFSITIPAGIKQFKISLVWSDPPAISNSSKAIVNDLDMELVNLTDNSIWLPWVLNPAPNSTALQQEPVRKKDSLNVVEQITIDTPIAASYIITVKAAAIPSGTQDFSIAYQLDSADEFNWFFPTGSDHLTSGSSNIVRFESGFASQFGLLELSIDNGTSWQVVSYSVDLSKGFYRVSIPDIFSKALLRMSLNGQSFTTNTFTISKRILTTVGFNCTDSFLFAWSRVPAASGYQIYQLNKQYLEPFLTTADTFVLLSKKINLAKHYAVAPLFGNTHAVRSYTFNYETAGTSCYFKSILARLRLDNEGEITVDLGTNYGILLLRIEKQTADGFTLIKKITNLSGLIHQALDPSVFPGTNRYRAVIELSGGRLIYSDIAIIYFVGPNPVVIYPNPVQRDGKITILAKIEDQLIFQLMDNMGRKVRQKQITEFPEQISFDNLPKGIYFFRILKENKRIYSGSIIIN